MERLENRWALSAAPVLTYQGQSPDPALEGSAVTVDFEFSDEVVGGGGSGFGIDASAYSAQSATNGDFVAAANILVDTTAGTLTTLDEFGDPLTIAGVPISSGGQTVIGFAFDSFTLGFGFTLTAVGNKPMAILTQGDISIQGQIDLRPQAVAGANITTDNSYVPGAGGGEGGRLFSDSDSSIALTGRAAAGAPSSSAGGIAGGGQGGGGAGFGGIGGNGATPGSAPGGIAYGDLLAGVIYGGSGGGAGSTFIAGVTTEGGDGGGGIELAAMGDILVSGSILADGLGGEYGVGNLGGGGGGAGGGILIHGEDVVVTGTLSANGGDGANVVSGGGGGAGGRILIAEDTAGSTMAPSVVVANISANGGLPGSGAESGGNGQIVTNHTYSSASVPETYSYYIDFGNGDFATGTDANITVVEPGSPGVDTVRTFSGSTTYADNGLQQVVVRVADSSMSGDFANGVAGVDYVELIVNVGVDNVAPSLVLSGDGSVAEGDVYTLGLAASDPGDDTITAWTINWGDGSIETVAGNTTSIDHVYADGAIGYTISATAVDEDDAYSSNSLPVTVANVAPALAISGAASVNEGAAYTLSLASSDPGDDTIIEWTIDWGDGNIETVAGDTASVDHVYADGDESYVISATATDEDDTYSSNSLPVTVANLAPALSVAFSSVTVNEGTVAGNGGMVSDVPTDAVTLTASIGVVTADGNGGWSWSFAATDGPLTETVVITADDGEGGVSTVSFDLEVVNVAPTANAGGPYLTFDDMPITLSGSGTDVAGAADPLSYTWDLDGDGIFGETGGDAGHGDEVGSSPVFDPVGLSGPVTVAMRVDDGDGGVTTAFTTVTVLNEGTLLIDGVLHVVGNNTANDIVLITQCGSDIYVYATFNDDNPAVFAAASVDKIQVRTRGGHDIVVTTSNVLESMTIDGGSGNDLLVGGGGGNVIYGGSGHDTLYGSTGDDVLFGGDGNDDIFGGNGYDVVVGGAGDDILDGGEGRDLLIGGVDSDRLQGGVDDDILIGGYTSHDGNLEALDSIMAIWGSNDSFSSRVAMLTAPGGWLVASGTSQTVFDDDSADHVIGSAGRDLAFADTSKNYDGVKDTISLSSSLDTLIALN